MKPSAPNTDVTDDPMDEFVLAPPPSWLLPGAASPLLHLTLRIQRTLSPVVVRIERECRVGVHVVEEFFPGERS